MQSHSCTRPRRAAHQGCAELAALAPGAVAKPEGVDADVLAGETDRAGVTTGLVEVAGSTFCVAQKVRRMDRLEDEIDTAGVCVVGVGIPERESLARIQALVADAVREGEVRQIGVFGEREVPEVPRVAAAVEIVRGVVPEERAAGGHVLIRSEERVELAGEPALGYRECEPARLGPVGIVARGRVKAVMVVHRCPHEVIARVMRLRRSFRVARRRQRGSSP